MSTSRGSSGVASSSQATLSLPGRTPRHEDGDGECDVGDGDEDIEALEREVEAELSAQVEPPAPAPPCPPATPANPSASEAIHPSLAPTPEAIHPSLAPAAEAIHPSLAPAPEAIHPSLAPVLEAVHPSYVAPTPEEPFHPSMPERPSTPYAWVPVSKATNNALVHTPEVTPPPKAPEVTPPKASPPSAPAVSPAVT